MRLSRNAVAHLPCNIEVSLSALASEIVDMFWTESSTGRFSPLVVVRKVRVLGPKSVSFYRAFSFIDV